MEKVIDYLQNEVREAKSIVKLDNGEFELTYNNEVVKRKRYEFEIVKKVYKCIKGFFIDIVDGDGFTLEESGKYINANDDMLIVENKDHAISKELYLKELELWGERPKGEIYTTIEVKANINVRDMLEAVLKKEEDNNMYEGWSDDVLFNVKDYDILLLQTIMNDIISRGNTSYSADKKVIIDI